MKGKAVQYVRHQCTWHSRDQLTLSIHAGIMGILQRMMGSDCTKSFPVCAKYECLIACM